MCWKEIDKCQNTNKNDIFWNTKSSSSACLTGLEDELARVWAAPDCAAAGQINSARREACRSGRLRVIFFWLFPSQNDVVSTRLTVFFFLTFAWFKKKKKCSAVVEYCDEVAVANGHWAKIWCELFLCQSVISQRLKSGNFFFLFLVQVWLL